MPVLLYVAGFGVSQLVRHSGDRLAGWPVVVVLVGGGLYALHQFCRRERPVLRLDEALGLPEHEREALELRAREHALQFDRQRVFDLLLARAAPARVAALAGG